MFSLKRTIAVLAIAASTLGVVTVFAPKAHAAPRCFFCVCDGGKCSCVEVVCPVQT
jgi:hypothetical protein